MATSNARMGHDNIQQVACLQRTREILKTAKVEQETVFLITNMPAEKLDAEQFMNLKREYWAIENKLHYRKDFVFGEDRSTIRAQNGPQNMSALRNFANSLLMANSIANVKRCVDNIKYFGPAASHDILFGKAA